MDRVNEMNELMEASKSLINFLKKYHPHYFVIVEGDTARLVESQIQVIAKED